MREVPNIIYIFQKRKQRHSILNNLPNIKQPKITDELCTQEVSLLTMTLALPSLFRHLLKSQFLGEVVLSILLTCYHSPSTPAAFFFIALIPLDIGL